MELFSLGKRKLRGDLVAPDRRGQLGGIWDLIPENRDRRRGRREGTASQAVPGEAQVGYWRVFLPLKGCPALHRGGVPIPGGV